MEHSRREILGAGIAGMAGLAGLGAIDAILADPALAAAKGKDISQALATQSGTLANQHIMDFWTQHARNTGTWNHVQSAIKNQSRTTVNGVDTDYTPAFYVSSNTGPITPVRNLTGKDLISSTDVLMDYRVVSYKPSTADHNKSIQSGSLRIDVRQATPVPQFSQPLSWSTVTALALEDNHLPLFVKQLADPKTYWNPNSIVLPNGQGYLAKNFFLEEKPRYNFWNMLFRGLSSIVEVAGIVSYVGVPLINQTTLQMVDGLYGTIAAANNAKIHEVLKTSDIPFATTQAGASQFGGDNAVLIRSGDYVIVPQWQSGTFEDEVIKADYKLVSGFLVPKSTTETNVQKLHDIAVNDTLLADYTYMVVTFSVEPYTIPAVPPELGILVGGAKSQTPSAATHAPGGHR